MCPSDIALLSHQGEPQPTANFDAPTPQDGQAPVTVTCNPGSGNEFPNGSTMVTCEAVDSLSRKGSCTFAVVVTLVPRITATKFLAFGDSLTEGKVRLTGRGIVVVPPNIFNEPASYVNQLDARLTARYQDQTITLIADGNGGETAGDAKLRLERDWPSYNPEAMLVIEGANDLLKPDTATPAGMKSAIDSVIDALRRMTRFAKVRGARVYLGALPPINAPKPANVIAAVPDLNNRIQQLATEENVQFVNHYAAITRDLVGGDGLHLTPKGYEVMADEWMKAIQATLEVKSETPPPAPARP
jgi:lysophospholipase L1-like esterase